MNSVDRHINAEGKAATLLAMRSARKEVLLVVEGDTDVDLFSNVLSIPRSNILSCNGKETLMLVYSMGPQKGIDAGSIFVKDRDNDQISSGVNNGVLIVVTQLYDIEMELLKKRLFARILSEFLKEPLAPVRVEMEFEKLCRAASYIGAIRLYSQRNDINLDFDDLKYTKFIEPFDMSVNLEESLRYIFAKSKVALVDKNAIQQVIKNLMAEKPAVEIVCSKEFLDILHLSLSRHYDACPSGECVPSILGRTIRISAIHDDLKGMTMYQPLKAHVAACGYPWVGAPL
ncbi:DUF4435 domain-containing protein [Acidisoma cellulosilytica]|uniref:DUF4435 domain-containing protein n=1 Tax=Acidisoma cellulosilyticum TaxID=2802395 RepID=A0A964E4M5_9PROT|nr:DUF4435 domain-containing protein [Acidisoma cellulosilyticum]MCB8881626.1 DUF4435 domain-containing protein [Acidisoma cellulosilyticum]